MNEKEEINKLITVQLFGEHFHILKRVLMGVFWATECAECGKSDTLNRDFCNSDADIREARGKIAEKGLEKDFGAALLKELTDAGIGWSAFSIVHAGTDLQARAIVRVLENL